MVHVVEWKKVTDFPLSFCSQTWLEDIPSKEKVETDVGVSSSSWGKYRAIALMKSTGEPG